VLHCWQSHLPAEPSHPTTTIISHLPADTLYYCSFTQNGNFLLEREITPYNFFPNCENLNSASRYDVICIRDSVRLIKKRRVLLVGWRRNFIYEQKWDWNCHKHMIDVVCFVVICVCSQRHCLWERPSVCHVYYLIEVFCSDFHACFIAYRATVYQLRVTRHKCRVVMNREWTLRTKMPFFI
jgi:hypothetical protein